MKLTVSEYAKEVCTSKVTVYNMIEDKIIETELEERHGNLAFVIDTDKYPVDKFMVRQRGAKAKKK